MYDYDANLISGLVSLINSGGNIKLALKQIWVIDSEILPTSKLGIYLKSIHWECQEFNPNGLLGQVWFYE
jgi:hypothetical protein